jgi:hypothetical protein
MITKFLQFNISFKLVDDGAVKTIVFTTYLMFFDWVEYVNNQGPFNS